MPYALAPLKGRLDFPLTKWVKPGTESLQCIDFLNYEDSEMIRNTVLLFVVLFVISPAHSDAKDFLGAPVISRGKIILETNTRLELETALSHDQVVSFYKEALKGQPDIRYRDWTDSTYIEDDGNLPWHSITVSKGNKKTTTVIIVKDNWTWIIGTLVLRFIGVFFVLLILFAGMWLSGNIISRWIKNVEEAKGRG
jgi:hypothetical protein